MEPCIGTAIHRTLPAQGEPSSNQRRANGRRRNGTEARRLRPDREHKATPSRQNLRRRGVSPNLGESTRRGASVYIPLLGSSCCLIRTSSIRASWLFTGLATPLMGSSKPLGINLSILFWLRNREKLLRISPSRSRIDNFHLSLSYQILIIPQRVGLQHFRDKPANASKIRRF